MRILVSLVAVLVASTAYAIRVPEDCASIGEAVMLASSGDTIEVAAGTYSGPENRNIEIFDKSLSFVGRGLVIMDVEGYGRSFLVDGYEIENGHFSFENMVFFNGSLNYGSGIVCRNATITIKNCAIAENRSYWGSGIVMENCDLVVENCVFYHNSALSAGSSFFLSGGNTSIRGCIIEDEGSTSWMECNGSSGTVLCCIINSTLEPCLFNNDIFSERVDFCNPEILDFRTGPFNFHSCGSIGTGLCTKTSVEEGNISWGFIKVINK